jgi:hypothetical protein
MGETAMGRIGAERLCPGDTVLEVKGL